MLLSTAYRDQTLLPGGGKNQMICDFQKRPTPENVCAFDVSKLGPCNTEEGYSYNKSAPCIFIKLNRVSTSVKNVIIPLT